MKNFAAFGWLILSPFALFAQGPDVNVVASHVFDGAPGVLSISVGTQTSPPYSLTITGPNGFVFNTIINSNSYVYWNLMPGEYCISVTNTSGCAASLCITIKKCYSSSVSGGPSVICEETYPTDPSVIYARVITSPVTTPASYQYDLLSSSQIIGSILDQIVYLISETKDEIETNGYSVYEIGEQNEIESGDYDYLFKFVDSNIVWVFYENYLPLQRNVKTREPKWGTERIKLKPNPTSDLLEVVIVPDEDNLKYQMSIYNTAGERFLSNVEIGTGITQVDVGNFPSGLYFVVGCSGSDCFSLKFAVAK